LHRYIEFAGNYLWMITAHRSSLSLKSTIRAGCALAQAKLDNSTFIPPIAQDYFAFFACPLCLCLDWYKRFYVVGFKPVAA